MTVEAALPRICFVIEVGPDNNALSRAKRALESRGAATLILAPHANSPLTAESARPIVRMAQERGVAALIEDDADLAQALGADGVHLRWHEHPLAVYETARKLLGKEAIVGADAGHSRHDAMELGESGADYVAFSSALARDGDQGLARQAELVAWWAEVFEIPVVAFDVDSAEAIETLTEAGADFLAARIPLDAPEQSITAWAEGLQDLAVNSGAD